MIYVTGDTHGDFTRIRDFCKKHRTGYNDIMIILGDAGINFSSYYNDINKKRFIKKIPITFFCVHGNHEKRPNTVFKDTGEQVYKEVHFYNGIAYHEEEYPNIYFAKDGEVYDFNTLRTLVIGGAYSVDKDYRLENGYPWFEDEQPDDTTKNKVREVIKHYNYDFDIILTHTAPYTYMPVEMFLRHIDQSKVDNSTEKFLNEIEEKIKYKKWYCGHYHCNKTIDKVHILYDNFDIIEV